jgi:hypothetical protein
MICPVDIRYEPFDCGPTVYVGNSVDAPAIAAELALAPIKADTTHDTMLDDLLVMNFLPIKAINVRTTLSPLRQWRQWLGRILLEVRVVMMKVL